MPIEFFSQRLLNPFRGISCTIRFESAEAVTTDGWHWDIYVRNELMLDDVDEAARHKVLTNDLRYGSWNPDDGLVRGPIYPSDDFELLEHYGNVVFDALLHKHDQLPFPLTDSYELWLLDTADRPLALLESASDERDMDLEALIEWRAGLRCQRDFQSQTVNCDNPAEYLTGYVNDLAGDSPSAQWIRRSADGQGVGLAGIGMRESLQGRRLAADDFPDFHLAARGHDEAHRQLLAEFEDWLAPWLLVLPGLNRSRRQAFEQLARRQALAVDEQYRLYPEMVDPAQIDIARVEARLRRNQASQQVEDTPDINPFYLEITGSE